MSLVVPVGKDDHMQGSETAPVTLVEYGDYQCPYCAAASAIVKLVQDQLHNQIRFVFRNFPLAQVHPQAEFAAEAAEAAGAQGRFWEMHDALYENQPALSPALIAALAQALELDMERFEKDLASGRFRERVKRDFMGGVRSGVAGTPTFFINGERHDGGWDEASLLRALRAAAYV
ncbi:protein-disulfide isomerase [Nitrosospira sp. Nsp2]|uniref:DsbA family protein n=1 Tax=Nitrosospira sp. Nsp2 TaxID=136548 RepID=UPI000D30E7AB|nr:thioredoxin domain-containing protein [Nitrosospira sp. Nsp2]PTR16171.1 protein-disulfide isomerase [Nitrosospira sp. Nsp2]